GLSRAYLHKIELHLQRGSVDAPNIHAAALARAEEIRRQITKLEQKAIDARAERDTIIRELGHVMSTAEIAADAGLTGERARIILQETAAGACADQAPAERSAASSWSLAVTTTRCAPSSRVRTSSRDIDIPRATEALRSSSASWNRRALCATKD